MYRQENTEFEHGTNATSTHYARSIKAIPGRPRQRDRKKKLESTCTPPLYTNTVGRENYLLHASQEEGRSEERSDLFTYPVQGF